MKGKVGNDLRIFHQQSFQNAIRPITSSRKFKIVSSVIAPAAPARCIPAILFLSSIGDHDKTYQPEDRGVVAKFKSPLALIPVSGEKSLRMQELIPAWNP